MHQRSHRRVDDPGPKACEHARGGKVLDDIIQRYPFHEMALREADRILREAEEPNYEAALESSARAISNGKIDVFFSFKHQDMDAAKAIVDTLRGISSGKLNITYSADFGDLCDIAVKRFVDNDATSTPRCQGLAPACFFSRQLHHAEMAGMLL